MLLALQLVLPTLVLKTINRQLAPKNLRLNASVRISLPNLITLTNVKIQSDSEKNTASAEQLAITVRPSALLKQGAQRFAHISIQGIRGSWNVPPSPPIGEITSPAELPLPKQIPDAFDISIDDFVLTLPATPGAPVRQILIKSLTLDASITREGTFHVDLLRVGNSDLLSNTTGVTTFFNKQLSVSDLHISQANFIEHLKLDFGTVSNQPSLDFLLLRENGYISAKASIAMTQNGQSLSLRADAENVTLPLDPFATNPRRTLPHVEVHESHSQFEGRLSDTSSWRANISFSGSLVDATDTGKKSALTTQIIASEQGFQLEKLSIEDPSLELTASASASLNRNGPSFHDNVSNLSSLWTLKYSAQEAESPLRQLAGHFGNPFPEWLPSTQISARLTQSETRTLNLNADFEVNTAPALHSPHPARGTLIWSAPSINNPLTGTLEIETQSFKATLGKTPISLPPSHLRLINHQSDRQITLTLHLTAGSTPILTQETADSPWKLSLKDIPLSELFPKICAENPSTLSADMSIVHSDLHPPVLTGSVRIVDSSNQALLEAHIIPTREARAEVTASLLHQTSRVAVAEITIPPHPSKSETTITSTGNLTHAHAFRNIFSIFNLTLGLSSRIAWSANAHLSSEHPLPVGRISCDTTGITFSNIGPFDLKSTVVSNGSSIETQATTLTLGETTATGTVQWSNTLDIKNLRILQRNRPVLHGELAIHHPVNERSTPASDTPLSASLEADQLDLATLLGDQSPLTGKIHGTMTLNGTVDQPVIRGKLTSTKLALPGSLAPLNPMAIEIQSHPAPGIISLSARVSSALNAPLEMTYQGSIRSLLFPETPSESTAPDTFTLNLKGGSLQPLNKLNEIFKSVTGSVDLSLTAKRTDGKWEWSGKSSVKAPKLLFESPRAPGLTDLTLNATVKDSTTTTIDLLTSTGGGTIRIRGDVQSLFSSNPLLDLSIQTRNVLAYRNESLLLRADSDLTFKGPWKEASISGEAAPIQSKYLHDIEILPINLTRKGETRDRLKGLSPGFSFSQAPYSDWKFNLHFKSRPRDPLLVRGNRWQGEADVDMIWGGTGLRPWFEGYYHSNNLTAFLPSVRLAVTDGYLWYKRENPFQGTLDVNALTTTRGYRVAAYISGPLSQPDLLLTSKPALDQTDLLSLLTTGVLPSDTNDSPQVIAARATEAIAEDLSRSLLGVDRRMIEGIGRVDVEFSRVNPRTGQQETRVTRRLSEDWSVSGDIGTNGDFTGRLKFLHRFK